MHEQGMAGPNWAEECMKPAQKRAILTAFNASKAKLARVPGSFCLYGADFIIDDTEEQIEMVITGYPKTRGRTRLRTEVKVGNP